MPWKKGTISGALAAAMKASDNLAVAAAGVSRDTTNAFQKPSSPFKKLPGSRHSAFLELDRPVLAALPATRMEVAQFKPARVNIDYHVEVTGHYSRRLETVAK